MTRGGHSNRLCTNTRDRVKNGVKQSKPKNWKGVKFKFDQTKCVVVSSQVNPALGGFENMQRKAKRPITHFEDIYA